jgi:hypothetical protein
VTIGRTVSTAALIGVLSISICAIGVEAFYLHWLRGVVAGGDRDLLQTAPETLDRELRGALVSGTPESSVETVLRERRVHFRYDPGRHVIRAEARHLKGSSPFAETGLYVWFFLDPETNLERVESRVTHNRSKVPFRIE